MFEKIKIMVSPLTRGQKKLLMSIDRENLCVPDKVHNYYVRNVRNNRFDTMETCKSKLIRNIILGEEIERDIFVVKYQYGNLSIRYDRLTNTINNVVNRVGYYEFNNCNPKAKEWLERFLHI